MTDNEHRILIKGEWVEKNYSRPGRFSPLPRQEEPVKQSEPSRSWKWFVRQILVGAFYGILTLANRLRLLLLG